MGLTMICRAEYTPPCKHAHVCVFGPLSIIILYKSLTIFMQISIVDMGMKRVHLCFDNQLYDVTIQVC